MAGNKPSINEILSASGEREPAVGSSGRAPPLKSGRRRCPPRGAPGGERSTLHRPRPFPRVGKPRNLNQKGDAFLSRKTERENRGRKGKAEGGSPQHPAAFPGPPPPFRHAGVPPGGAAGRGGRGAASRGLRASPRPRCAPPGRGR